MARPYKRNKIGRFSGGGGKVSGKKSARKAAARKENDAKKMANARTGSNITSARAAQIKAEFEKAEAAKKKRNGR